MDEIPMRGPEPRAVKDNLDVPSDLGDLPITVRTFEGGTLLGEHTMGGPSRMSQKEPPQPEKSNALDFSPALRDLIAMASSASVEPVRPVIAPVAVVQEERKTKPPPQLEVTFIGAFGEITAPFSSVVRQNDVVVLTQVKGQSFRFTPKRTEADETFTLSLEDGTNIIVSNPGIVYDRTCPCCGVKERCIVLLEIKP